MFEGKSFCEVDPVACIEKYGWDTFRQVAIHKERVEANDLWEQATIPSLAEIDTGIANQGSVASPFFKASWPDTNTIQDDPEYSLNLYQRFIQSVDGYSTSNERELTEIVDLWLQRDSAEPFFNAVVDENNHLQAINAISSIPIDGNNVYAVAQYIDGYVVLSLVVGQFNNDGTINTTAITHALVNIEFNPSNRWEGLR